MKSSRTDCSGNFETIFQCYKNQTFDFAFRMLGDNDAAGDITQEVYIRLFKVLRNNSQIKDIKSWLFIAVRNLCLNKIRDGHKEISLDSIPNENLGYDNDPDTNRIVLEKSLLSLETRFREALILKEYQGFSYKEMAQILQITVPAVRSLLFKARMRLKDNFHRINNGRLLK